MEYVLFRDNTMKHHNSYYVYFVLTQPFYFSVALDM